MIEVPFALALHPNGVENAPNAFREAGLHARLRAHDVVRTEVPPYRQLRDTATQILNPQAIALLAARVADAVTAALDDAAFPIVLGGDCSLLLGPLLALCRRGRYGLAFIDGHADFWHPSDEPTGEAASLDLALATGRGPTILTNIEKRRPLVRDEDVALIGHRAFRQRPLSRRAHARHRNHDRGSTPDPTTRQPAGAGASNSHPHPSRTRGLLGSLRRRTATTPLSSASRESAHSVEFIELTIVG